MFTVKKPDAVNKLAAAAGQRAEEQGHTEEEGGESQRVTILRNLSSRRGRRGKLNPAEFGEAMRG